MTDNIRIRLKFDSTPVSYAQKCWFTFESERCKLVMDVCYLIASHFNLKAQGIQLYMDDYLIPTNENAKIIRDNDNLQVKTVESALEDSDSDESPAELQPKPKQPRICRIEPKCRLIQGEMMTSTRRKNSEVIKLPSPPPAVKELFGVTTKSATGALHTKFQSSSSSSSDNSSSASVRSADRKKVPPKKVTQWDVGKNGKRLTEENKNSAANENRNEVVNTTNKRRNSTARRGRKVKHRKNVRHKDVIGGPSDILTTKSIIYNSCSTMVNTGPLGRGRLNTANIKESCMNSRNKNLNAVAESPGQGTVDEQSPAEHSKQMLLSGCEASAIELESLEAEASEDPVPDYSSCPDLHGPPRSGDKLVFKVLELSSDYTPVISEYMEGTVLGYDVSTTMVTVKYSESSLRKLMKKDESDSMGKFALDTEALDTDEDGEKEDEVPLELISVVDINLRDLIKPKLLV